MRAQPRAATNLDNQIRPRQSLNSISFRVVHQPKLDALALSARGGPPATLLPVHMLRKLTAAWGQRSTCCYVHLAGVPLPHPSTLLPAHMLV
jgi:hypothetical protein